jgi:PAS domain S-box-containing protein
MSLDRNAARFEDAASGRERETLFRVLFENTHDFAFLLEPGGLVLEANDRASAFTGSATDETVGIPIWQTPWFRAADESRHRLREDLQRAVGGDDIDRTYRLAGPARSVVVDVAMRPVSTARDGDDLLLITASDVTDRHRQISELETQQECFTAFARELTHDIRGLLEVATGNLALAMDGAEQAELATVRESLNRIEQLLDHCSETILDGDLIGDRETLNLAVVATEAWQHVETSGASLTIESSTTVRADRTRLMTVFENLYRNSVEHGSTGPDSQASQDAVEHGSTSPDSQARQDAVDHAGPAVTVRVGATEQGFYVEDDGPGVPDDQALFEPGVSTSANGMGLGLAIVETVVDAHGWSIRATEGTASGARFEIQTDRTLAGDPT